MSMHTMPYSTKALRNLADDLGSHFFSPSAMRFFSSRMLTHTRRVDDLTMLFITSEKSSFTDETRVFNLRIAQLVPYTRDDGRECQRMEFTTVCTYANLYTAKNVMKGLDPYSYDRSDL